MIDQEFWIKVAQVWSNKVASRTKPPDCSIIIDGGFMDGLDSLGEDEDEDD